MMSDTSQPMWMPRTGRRHWLFSVGKQALLYVLGYAGLLSVGILMVAPFFWMLSTALKETGGEFMYPPQWLPDPWVFGNFLEVFVAAPFFLFVRNTLIVALGAMSGTILSASLVAFGFARLRFPGRNVLFVILLTTLMLPSVVTLIPTFIIFSRLKWVGTFLPLIVPYWFGGGAFNIFLVRQFYMTIPIELDEAARMDGASTWRIWWQVLVPLSRPAIATVAIFSFLHHWNDFMNPLIYIRSMEMRTISLGLQNYSGMTNQRWNLLMAASTLATLPILALFFAFQRYFIEGIVTTGMAGR